MTTVTFSGGTLIGSAAKQLVEAAAIDGYAEGTFNEIVLTANPDTRPESIVVAYDYECKRRSEAYRASPEGIAAADERERSRSESQSKHDALMKQLPSLNMRDDSEVLGWLCDMQEPSDHSGVILRRQTILQAFENAGYVAGANCGADYKPGNRANMFRYLVGQALSGLKDGPSIHPIIHKFADEWRSEFGVKSK